LEFSVPLQHKYFGL